MSILSVSGKAALLGAAALTTIAIVPAPADARPFGFGGPRGGFGGFRGGFGPRYGRGFGYGLAGAGLGLGLGYGLYGGGYGYPYGGYYAAYDGGYGGGCYLRRSWYGGYPHLVRVCY